MLRRSSPRGPASALLPWAPPVLTSPVTVDVTTDPATREINVAGTVDVLITSSNVIEFVAGANTDAMIDCVGGRRWVIQGLHFRATPGPVTTVGSAVAINDTTVSVASTIGFPTAGALRIDGEQITYTGVTATTFTGCTRRVGFFNDSAVSSDTVHAIGATVWLGEYSRSALTMSNNQQAVHIEGCRFDDVNDAVRIIGGGTDTVTIQNCHIGPNKTNDPAYQTSGHPDGVQLIDGGTKWLRIANTTFESSDAARGILNAAAAGGGTAVPLITLRNVEFISRDGNKQLINNADGATAWDVMNTWLRTDLAKDSTLVTDSIVAEMMGRDRPASLAPEFCPRESVGIGYVSPGYL